MKVRELLRWLSVNMQAVRAELDVVVMTTTDGVSPSDGVARPVKEPGAGRCTDENGRIMQGAQCTKCGWKNTAQWRRFIRTRLVSVGGSVRSTTVDNPNGGGSHGETIVTDPQCSGTFRSLHRWWHVTGRFANVVSTT